MVQVDPNQPVHYSFGVVAGAPILWNNDPKGVVQRIQNIATWLFVTSIRIVSFGHLASWQQREVAPVLQAVQDESLAAMRDLQNQVREKQQETERAKGESAAARHELQQLSAELSRAKATIGEADQAKKDLGSLQAQHRRLEGQKASIRREIADLRRINQHLTEEGMAAEVLSVRREIEKKNDELSAIQNKLVRNTYELNRLRKDLSDVKRENRRLRGEYNSTDWVQRIKLDHLQRKVSRLQNENAQLKGQLQGLRQQPRAVVRVGKR